MFAKLHAGYHIYLDDDIVLIQQVSSLLLNGVYKIKNIFLFISISPLGLVLKHTQSLVFRGQRNKKKTSICPVGSSKNCEVVAGL